MVYYHSFYCHPQAFSVTISLQMSVSFSLTSLTSSSLKMIDLLDFHSHQICPDYCYCFYLHRQNLNFGLQQKVSQEVTQYLDYIQYYQNHHYELLLHQCDIPHLSWRYSRHVRSRQNCSLTMNHILCYYLLVSYGRADDQEIWYHESFLTRPPAHIYCRRVGLVGRISPQRMDRYQLQLLTSLVLCFCAIS